MCKKLSHIKKFSCQKMFVPATPYRSNMQTLYTAMKNFVHLFSYTTTHTNIFDNENFPNYSISLVHCMHVMCESMSVYACILLQGSFSVESVDDKGVIFSSSQL